MISLCIPTYNRLTYLKRCLESILTGFEDYPYEVIIADGGSTDGTLEYVKGLNSDNIKLIEQGKLTGITKAYNESFKIVKGDYIFVGNDDTFLFPKVFIKSCKLMDREERIGLVAPKDQEPRHGNLPAVTLKMKKYWALLSKFHIFRASVLKEINYYDENLRSYYTDDDSCLSVLNLGYTITYTKEVGMIHYRAPDEDKNPARKKNFDNKRLNQEQEYMKKKWENLTKETNDYLKPFYLKRKKTILFAQLSSKIYDSNLLQTFIKPSLYDWFLERTVIFEDKNFANLKDFYLTQKYPDDIISNIV